MKINAKLFLEEKNGSRSKNTRKGHESQLKDSALRILQIHSETVKEI